MRSQIVRHVPDVIWGRRNTRLNSDANGRKFSWYFDKVCVSVLGDVGAYVEGGVGASIPSTDRYLASHRGRRSFFLRPEQVFDIRWHLQQLWDFVQILTKDILFTILKFLLLKLLFLQLLDRLSKSIFTFWELVFDLVVRFGVESRAPMKDRQCALAEATCLLLHWPSLLGVKVTAQCSPLLHLLLVVHHGQLKFHLPAEVVGVLFTLNRQFHPTE